MSDSLPININITGSNLGKTIENVAYDASDLGAYQRTIQFLSLEVKLSTTHLNFSINLTASEVDPTTAKDPLREKDKQIKEWACEIAIPNESVPVLLNMDERTRVRFSTSCINMKV